jgi:hypothetical protein
MELNDVLDDKEVAVEAPAPEAPEAPAAPEAVPESGSEGRKAFQEKERTAQEGGKVRDPATGQFVQKEEKEEVKETKEPKEPKPEIREEMSPKERALLAAAQDERNKRQEWERRFKELESKTPQGEQKTFWDDPEGHLQKFQGDVQNMIVRTRLDTSEASQGEGTRTLMKRYKSLPKS